MKNIIFGNGIAAKVCLTLTVFFTMVLLSCMVSYGAPVEDFKITGGIDTSKASEITFDSSRVISGTAEKGTLVTITVYEPYTDAKGAVAYNSLRTYKVTVGATGIFSQSISLKEGKNYIVVIAQNNGKHSEVKTTVNRKNKVLQAVLSKSVALPGGSAW